MDEQISARQAAVIVMKTVVMTMLQRVREGVREQQWLGADEASGPGPKCNGSAIVKTVGIEEASATDNVQRAETGHEALKVAPCAVQNLVVTASGNSLVLLVMEREELAGAFAPACTRRQPLRGANPRFRSSVLSAHF